MVTNKTFHILQCELKDLEETHEELLKKYSAIKEENEELHDKIRDQNLAVKKATGVLQDTLEITKRQQALLDFMVQGVFDDDESIEFVGIKTYRGGWEVLSLNGNKIDVNRDSDVTIWANANEAVNIDVSNR